MPILLKPVSRRRFITTSGLAALGLSAWGSAFASSRGADKDYFALFSDPHIAANPDEISRGVNMTANLRKAVGEVLAPGQAQPAALLVNGDCAFSTGEEADYSQFISLLDPIQKKGIPAHLTLGNHDHRQHFAKILHHEDAVGKPVAEHYVTTFQSARANWFLMDSLDKAVSPPGKLGTLQLEWLAQALDKESRKPAIVVVHHNPFFSEGKNSGLLDTAELMAVLRPRRHVKAVIYGHTHTWKTTVDESGIHLVNLPPVAYVFTEGQPSGWVKAQLEKNSLHLELRCMDTAHPAHGETKNLPWRA